MNDINLPDEVGEVCPKRVWVMMMLSDDEAVEAGGELPRGLQFHLSRCESCRSLAERLRTTSDALRALSGLEPSEELADRAKKQLLTALSDGAELTGRATIPEDLATEAEAPPIFAWRRARQYVAAAVVVFAVGFLGWSQLVQRDRTSSVATTEAGGPPTSPMLQPGAPGDREGDRFSSGSSSHVAQVSERANVPAPDAGGEGELAVGTSPAEPRDVAAPVRSPRRICDYHSYVEAAMCDDPGCVHRAVILPRREGRNLGWGSALFDNPASTVSTRPRSGDE